MMTFPSEWNNNPNVPNHQPDMHVSGLLQSNRAYSISIYPSIHPIYLYMHVYTCCSVHTRHNRDIDIEV